MVRAYEDMGIVLFSFRCQSFWMRKSTVTVDRGSRPKFVPSLIRSSHVKISAALAVEFMRQAPSVRIDARGNHVALSRLFVLPDFEVLRAALVMSDT